jgi:hypothetical protein
MMNFVSLHMQHSTRLWFFSLLLMSPATIPYLYHYTTTDGLIPTGFIQGDQQHYMAAAREHFDGGAFSLTYGNPFSPSYETPKIYFQPQTLILGLLWKATGWDPGIVFVVFGFLAAWGCARIALALYDDVVGLASPSHWIGLVVFFWGGGILVLCGLVVTAFYSFYGGVFTVSNIFRYDPFTGWWMLNFGRTLVTPLEAFYHALFFGCILSIRRRRFWGAAALAVGVSMAHPYTGTELLAILFVWSFIEMLLNNSSRYAPPSLFIVSCVVTTLHLLYYLVYLPHFPEHRVIMTQWYQPWFLRWDTMIPAYALVGAAALWRVRRFSAFKKFVADGKNRLFLVWFIVAVLLANHELFIHPTQPLHFARGYIWTSLFFIGISSILTFIDRLRRHTGMGYKLVLLVTIALFLSDNATWLSISHGGDVRLTTDERQLLEWMDSPDNTGALLLSQDDKIGDLSTVYTPLRTWYAHGGITPNDRTRHDELDSLFTTGKFLEAWSPRRLLVVFAHHATPASEAEQFRLKYLARRTLEKKMGNASYTAFVFR